MRVVITGSMITVALGTELSKLSIGRDTVIAIGVPAGVAVAVAVAIGVGVPPRLGVGVGQPGEVITMLSTRTPLSPAAATLLSVAARHFNWMFCPLAAGGR